MTQAFAFHGCAPCAHGEAESHEDSKHLVGWDHQKKTQLKWQVECQACPVRRSRNSRPTPFAATIPRSRSDAFRALGVLGAAVNRPNSRRMPAVLGTRARAPQERLGHLDIPEVMTQLAALARLPPVQSSPRRSMPALISVPVVVPHRRFPILYTKWRPMPWRLLLAPLSVQLILPVPPR